MWKLQENILENNDKKILIDFINSTDRFTQFDRVKKFESDWNAWQGCRYSTFVNSGSSADLLMLDAVKEYYGLPDGSEVLVPAVTWITNINSVIQNNLLPVFVDINLKDLSFDYNDLEKKITPKTKIILVTHLIGVPADVGKILDIAHRHNLIVLEDACESHGATYQGKKVGNFGTASAFSFYWGHHFTTVEGGMICTDNKELNDLFVLKRSHGLARELSIDKHEKFRQLYPNIDFNFLFITRGYNVRNTEFNAVLGVAQLKNLDNYIAIRNDNHRQFLDIVEKISDKIYIIDNPGISSFCLPFIFKNLEDKKKMQAALVSCQVESRPIIGANLLRQPCLKGFGEPENFPNAEIVHNNGFYVGNNQFVNKERLALLDSIVRDTFRTL